MSKTLNYSHAEKGLQVQFLLVRRVMTAAGVLPLSTAEVERVFSQLMLIKTNHRYSLKTKRLEQLLNIQLNCTDDLFSKPTTIVVKTFYRMKSRRLVNPRKKMF